MRKLSFLIAVLFFSGTALYADVAHDISEKAKPVAQGSMKDGYDYARSLYADFKSHGVESYLIQFAWQPAPHLQGYEGYFVVFKDTDGRYWGQESTSLEAKWLSGTSALQWTRSLYPDASLIQVLSVEGDGPVLARASNK